MRRPWRQALVFAGVAALVLATVVALSPFAATAGFRRAGLAGDSRALAAKVDFPSVRAELHRTVSARLLHRVRTDDEISHNPMAGFSLLALPSLVERAVISVASPEGLAALVQTGEAPRTPIEARYPPPPAERPPVHWRGRHVSWNAFEVVVRRADAPPSRSSRLLFERRALMGWRLTRVSVPA
jgi:hypothetical protein